MIPSDYSESQVPSSELLFDLWMKQIYTRVHDGKFNYNGMLVGDNRSGKSMTALNMGHVLDEDFSVDDVVYTIDQFFDRVLEIKKIGKVIIPDEIGVLLSVREWYKIQSKAINFTIQTVGYLRPIILFVAPDFSYIDNQPKKVFSAFGEVTRRPYDNYCRVKPFNLQIDRKKGKIYFHYPRFMIKDFGLVKLHRLKIVGLPPEEVVKEYERKSFPYKKALAEKMAELAREKKKETVKSGEEYLTEEEVIAKIVETPEHFSTRGRIDVSLIMHDEKIEGKKISRDVAYAIKKVAERNLKEKD